MEISSRDKKDKKEKRYQKRKTNKLANIFPYYIRKRPKHNPCLNPKCNLCSNTGKYNKLKISKKLDKQITIESLIGQVLK